MEINAKWKTFYKFFNTVDVEMLIFVNVRGNLKKEENYLIIF